MDIGEQVLYTATKCGHLTRQRGHISAYGRKVYRKMPFNDIGSVDYCLECICSMTIQCIRCGNAIFVYDPIVLYAPKDNPSIPVYAKFYKGKFVGCLNDDCAEKGTKLGGFWEVGKNGNGFVLEAPKCDGVLYKMPIMQRRPHKPLMT